MRTVRYGDDPQQVADLHLPAGEAPHPTVVLVHGGFWRARYARDLMEPLAADLTARGVAAWNVEYRRLGQPGGGWPGTLDDVRSAVAALADQPEVDPTRVAVVGHSAGGHLALWVAGEPGPVRVRAAVSQAGVADLRAGAAAELGAGAVRELLGGDPLDVPDRYAAADPAARLPIGVRQVLVHGRSDDAVPVEQSRSYAARAREAGDDVELVELDGAHFEHLEVGSAMWAAVVDRLPALLGY